MKWCLAIALVIVCGVISPAAGQTSGDGTIRGYVRDSQGAVVPGATVAAASPTVPVPYTTVSDAEGYYRLVSLPPGTYTLTAELQGFSKYVRENVLVRAGLNIAAEIVMQVGTLEETVRVALDTPMLESTSAGQSINIAGDFQRTVPIASRRNWSDFLELTPGVTTYTSGVEYFYLRGANLDAHVVQIDGVDISSGQQGGPNYVKMSTESIADVEVRIGGVDASSPLGLGAVVNVATPTGTNVPHGSAAAMFQGRRWNGNNSAGGTSSAVRIIQPDLSLGGPILHDRAWFFSSYRYLNREEGVARTPQQIATLQALVPGWQPFDGVVKAHNAFVKGTVQLAPNQQVYAFYQRDYNPRAGVTSATAAGRFGESVTGGYAVASRLSSVWGQSATTRFSLAYTDKSLNSEVFRTDMPVRQVHQGTLLSGGRLVGTGVVAMLDNAGNGQDINDPKIVATADATWFRSGWIGSHEFQTGFYLEHVRENNFLDYVNGGFAVEEVVMRDPGNPGAGLIPFRRQVYDQQRLNSSKRRRSDVAVYFQDAWRPTPRLTVNAGVRIDAVRHEDQLFNVQTQSSVDVGPRFGVNYRLTEDGHNTIVASWVRVHDMLFRTNTGAGTNVNGYRELYDLDFDGVFETTFVTPSSTALATNVVLDPDAHQPYIDEWSTSYRRQLPGQVAVEVGLNQRQYRDRRVNVETNGIYENGVFRGYRNEALNEINLATNNRWNWPIYTGLELRAVKQASRLHLLANYTRQWRHLEGTWQPNDPASFIQPETFGNDKGIGSTHGSDANSLSGTAQARAPQWKDHQVRLGATFRAPWRMVLATSYIYQSGVWSGPIVTRVSEPDPRFGPPTVRLSNGRVVSNPLATVVRFAYPTLGEGQFRPEGSHTWNVRVGHDLLLGKHRVELALDVFNVLNGAAYEDVEFGSNQLYSPLYGMGRSLQLPRSAQAFVRYAF